MNDAPKPSKVEIAKEQSNYLRGNVAAELADPSLTHVSDESYELLKFHGTYQGYDRDSATERKKAGQDKLWEFMLRMKAPAGVLSADQYLALDKICEQYANGTLRITTRQTFQFHCVVKENLKQHIKAINELLITTLGGCGDVVRNVVTSPAPFRDAKHEQLRKDAFAIAEFTYPKTKAYHEIWLDGENVAETPEPDQEEIEPLYGKYYLPRKFKISIALPEDNSVDVLSNDIGIVPVYNGDTLEGYNFYVGGGHGMTHNKAETYPRLASPLAFIEVDDLLPAVEAIVKLQRDHGDRSNRKHARLKYVVEEKGQEWTEKTFAEYFGKQAEPIRPVTFGVIDHLGWHEQGDGKWFLGIPVSSGRIVDRGEERIKTGLAKVIETLATDIILTADQNIILSDIEEGQKEQVVSLLKEHGIKLREDISNVYRDFLACVALPTCGKALAEAERVKLPLVADIEKVIEKHQLRDEQIMMRMTGCPNGCARPNAGDIGIIGRMPGHYAIYVGGDYECTRVNQKILDRVPFDHICTVLDVLFADFVQGRNDAEGFGDYCHRKGIDAVVTFIKDQLGAEHKWAA